MATRIIKLREAEGPAPDMVQEVLSQSKRPEVGRFLLQVDRQTKGSYATAEAAEKAGMVIKKGHPIVRVTVYDSVETANKIIELPAGSSPTFDRMVERPDMTRECQVRICERLRVKSPRPTRQSRHFGNAFETSASGQRPDLLAK